MNIEKFIQAWFRPEFLAADVRKFESTNYLYKIVNEELDNGIIQSVRKKKPNKKLKRKITKTVQRSIPIDAVYKDGIFRTGRLFSKSWRFSDID